MLLFLETPCLVVAVLYSLASSESQLHNFLIECNSKFGLCQLTELAFVLGDKLP